MDTVRELLCREMSTHARMSSEACRDTVSRDLRRMTLILRNTTTSSIVTKIYRKSFL